MIINSIIIGSRNAIKLSNIIITKQPTKTSYNAKEAFDPLGMEVKAVFSNDASKMVTDFSIEPSGELKFSDTKVKIKYTELGVTAEVEQTISVAALTVAIPTINSSSFTYTGSAITPTWNNYDISLVSISGDTSATGVGSYTAVMTLKEPEFYKWSDGTTGQKTVTWSISKATVTVPTISTTPTYSGATITPTWNNYNSNVMSIGGDTSGVNAGTYTATFTLKDTNNYQWSDGKTAAKSVQWSINKAQAIVTVNKLSVNLNADKLTDTVTITTVGMKSVTAVSANTAVATVSQSNNVLTISSVNNTTGNTTITLSGVPDDNHNAPSYPSIAVNAEFIIKVAVPSQNGVVRYTGSTVTPTWNNYNSAQLTIGGISSAVDVGSYNATFTPKSGVTWEDGTTGTKTVAWEIRENWPEVLKDFNYTENDDGTATLTGWKQTLNGVSSTELIIPDNPRIIL